jgi:hypothetical protein
MITLRIVNKGLAGEPEHAVFQNIETNTVYEFSNILGETISDNDLTHPTIQQILNNGHQVQAEVAEDGMVTLHF